MEIDRKALKILMKAYKARWDVCDATDEEIAYCKEKGMMFDIETLEHDDFVRRLVAVKETIKFNDLGKAFVRSLGGVRPDLRSALGSYAVFKCFEPHEQRPTRQIDCEICGGMGMPRRSTDFSFLNYVRFKDQGRCSFHQQKDYALFDLEMFVKTNISTEPTEDDWSVFVKILSLADSMKPAARIAALASEVKKILGETKNQIQALVEILGYAGILQTKGKPSFFERYIDIAEPESRTERSDYCYPVDWWAGSDGVNWERVEYWFPDLPKVAGSKRRPIVSKKQTKSKNSGIQNELIQLLTELERISEIHDELCDTDVREELATAIYCGFIAPQQGYQTPESFEMFSAEGNAAVKKAVDTFLRDACPIANSLGWNEQQRQDAFQDSDVTSEGGLAYDEFFGHAD